MAGFVGRLGQWVDFEKKWKAILRRYGITHFHSRKLRQSKEQFQGWPRTKKANFMHEIADVADRHTVFGFTTMLRKADYDRHYIAGERPREKQLDSMYGICFRRSLSLICESTPYYLKRDDLEINFILEDGHKNAGDAVRIFNEIKSVGAPEIVRRLKAISFAGKLSYSGLQGADASAYIAFQQEMEGVELIVGPEIKSLGDARRRIKGRSPIFRDHLTPEMLKDARSSILEGIAAKKARAEARANAASS